MIVVSDTSPLNYLILIDAVDVLPKMYGTVLVPLAVADELLDLRAPAEVREWMIAKPEWIEVVDAGANVTGLGSWQLDRGEREAIALAVTSEAKLIVIDEAEGRRAAGELGLDVIGILGILRDASRMGLLSLPQAIARLRETRFHVSERILEDVLRSEREDESA